jgi:hypothetical protein
MLRIKFQRLTWFAPVQMPLFFLDGYRSQHNNRTIDESVLNINSRAVRHPVYAPPAAPRIEKLGACGTADPRILKPLL